MQSRPKNVHLLTLYLWGYWTNHQICNVGKILPLNIFELEWQYSNPFWNAAVPNEPIYPKFALKLVTMATSLEELGKEVQIDHLRTNTYHFVKNGENQSSGSSYNWSPKKIEIVKKK